jgi:hypothetical protein
LLGRINDVMDDFIAEMLAAQYLKAHDHAKIHFLFRGRSNPYGLAVAIRRPHVRDGSEEPARPCGANEN